MRIDATTTLYDGCTDASAVRFALGALRADLAAILGAAPAHSALPGSGQIAVLLDQGLQPEQYCLRVDEEARRLVISGGDDLGVVFGIYRLCAAYLGVDPYGFWTGRAPERRAAVTLPPIDERAPAPRVRFRGCFINDEDCLIGWHDAMAISPATWERVFETLLRAGYNMVIPGTGTHADDPASALASAMGLWVSQHHAEPLGARMFGEAYPGEQPRIPQDLPRLEALYTEAIAANRGRKVVWVLGFRGQGDEAFSGEGATTPAERGALIARMIRLQRELLGRHWDGPLYLAHYLYAESAALYRAGHLTLDDDLIRIWADNGFGAMRMRRESTGPEPHIVALPGPEERERQHGVYYHVSFHDLQVASKLTPLVAPQLIEDELEGLFDAGQVAYLLLNMSNLRPHTLGMELVGELAARPPAPGERGGRAAAVSRRWAERHVPSGAHELLGLLERYHAAPLRYGPYPDNVAGEQLYHHVTRQALRAVVKGENLAPRLGFIPLEERPGDTAGCLRWLLERAEPTLPAWEALLADAEGLQARLAGAEARAYEDLFLCHVRYLAHSCRGFVAGLRGSLAFGAGDYRAAFIALSRAGVAMRAAWQALAATEHGQWRNFFRGEWLTGTRETIRELETVRGLAKLLGDTDSWRSVWTPEALRLQIHTAVPKIIQASVEYDRLAEALAAGPDAPTPNLALLL